MAVKNEKQKIVDGGGNWKNRAKIFFIDHFVDMKKPEREKTSNSQDYNCLTIILPFPSFHSTITNRLSSHEQVFFSN